MEFVSRRLPAKAIWKSTLLQSGRDWSAARRGCRNRRGGLTSAKLPSFAVTGTEDDARVAWGFERFFRFFFGTLRQVYLPNAQLLDPFGDEKP